MNKNRKDPFDVNTTVHVHPSSPDVTGKGLWKLSVYGSKDKDGKGPQYQLVDNVLNTTQQKQSLTAGNDLLFGLSPGEIDIQGIGCGEYKFICVDFKKGDNPKPDFDFVTIQTPSHKFTLCMLMQCHEIREY